ncbi:hypothetical protein [Marinobacter bohaiensis]|uniref:hypothetical protein n=1 Tax=Marinobacter bohaiensis TaxID=2201898 RepID=UPI000DAF4182|nr:hypothetical protein [Marinobacter bohaiensis]
MIPWRRFLGTLVALGGVGLWFVFFAPQSGPELDQTQRLNAFSHLLDGVSHDWSMTDLQRLQHPAVADAIDDRQLVETGQSLGRFVGCGRLGLGDFADDALDQLPLNRLDAATVHQGNGLCAFEYGEAQVLLGYVMTQERPQLVLLEISDVRLFGDTR